MVGETTREASVAPVFQEKDEPPDAVSVVVPPAQIVVLPLIIAVMLEVTAT